MRIVKRLTTLHRSGQIVQDVGVGRKQPGSKVNLCNNLSSSHFAFFEKALKCQFKAEAFVVRPTVENTFGDN